jgi:FMN reductase
VNAVVVIGSATPPGRTQAMAAALADAIGAHAPGANVRTIDLANVAFVAADGRAIEHYDATIADAVQALIGADIVAIASPVYRATYAGVLKNFLDILPIEGLRDKPVGIAVLGASPHHYLGVDGALRAVLAWYGALAAPTSAYLVGSDFDERKLPNEKGLEQLDGLAGTLVALASGLGGRQLGPVPLAAKYS